MKILTLSLVTAFCASIGWSDENVGRFDCYPEPSGTQGECVQRGCIWDPQTNDSAPSCYYPSGWGYHQQGPVIETKNGSGKVYQLVWNNAFEFPYPSGIEEVSLEVIQISHACVRLRYFDAATNRYEVPIAINASSQKDSSADIYNFSSETSSSGLFGFNISRTNGDKEVVISTTNLPGLTYSNQFLQLLLSFPNQTQLYGWGERYSQVKIPTNKYTTLVSWSRDILDMPGNGNSYGVHPFLLGIEKNGNAFGILILNSDAMELVITPYPALQYRTIGGIIDVFVFFGPSAEQVIQQYWNIIGYPVLPPFWSLGFHLCRWGYNTLNVTRQTVEGMIEAKVPYDTQWNDIDYMNEKKDFTYDEVNFAGLSQFVNELHEKYGMHYVMIVDPAISNASGYAPYKRGLRSDVFIKNENGQVLLGEVWPGVTAFPDFFKNSTQKWWANEIALWYQVVPFDGLWIDMNEPSNFVTGQLGGCSMNPLDNPPYFPTALLANSGSTGLATKTLCMSAQQTDDKDPTNPAVLLSHYDVHSLYGYTEAVSTFAALKQLQQQRDKRPFVLSRSTYCGSGKYTAHWLGDNSATFLDMQISISGILAFNLFGIPFVGADICGFMGNTTLELCTRWMELGSFYPFSRNHNGYGFIPQDPVSLGEPVTSVSRKYLSLRYQLLPYLYTLLYRSNKYGEVVIHSIWLMDDWRTICLAEETCMSIETQFLWGKSLLISPALSANQTQVEAFFPALNNDNKFERWFEFSTGEELPIFGNTHYQWQTLDCPLEYLPLHIRGGFILPMQAAQGPNSTVGQTTTETRKNPFQLLAALDSNLRASGEIFVDDGESQDSVESGKYLLTEFVLACEKVESTDLVYLCVLQSNVTHHGFYGVPNPLIDSIVIYGFHNEYFMPGVDWTNSEIDIAYVGDNETLVDTQFDANYGVLRLTFFSNVTTISITDNIFIGWTMTIPTNGGGNNNGSHSKNNIGLIVGVVVGVVLAVVLILGIIYFVRNRKKQQPHEGDYVSVHDSNPL